MLVREFGKWRISGSPLELIDHRTQIDECESQPRRQSHGGWSMVQEAGIPQ
jgi:hypothetical protein